MKRPTLSVPFLWLAVSFCVCLILANLLATKPVRLGVVEVSAAALVFPVSYIINDCIAEVWGFRRVRFVTWMGFLMNFFFVLLAAVADAMPSPSYWDNAEGFHRLFGLAPRVVGASFLAFLCGSLLNGYIMSALKVAHRGRHFSRRAVVSTVAGELVDSLLFFPLALGGVVPWPSLWLIMGCELVLKVAFEMLVLPLTSRLVLRLKRHEGVDVYDDRAAYNPFKIFEV